MYAFLFSITGTTSRSFALMWKAQYNCFFMYYKTISACFYSCLLLHILCSQELVLMPATWSEWTRFPSSRLMKGGLTNKSSSTPSGGRSGNVVTLTSTSQILIKRLMPTERTRSNSCKDEGGGEVMLVERWKLTSP